MCISVYMFVAVCTVYVQQCEFKQCTIVVDLVDIRVFINIPVVLKKASYHILSFLIEQNVTAPWINIS